MSLGYAEKLSFIDDVGNVGMAEFFNPPHVLQEKDALPRKEMDPAEKHCKMADLVLCLGTSLQITPACNLPLRCLKGGGKITIVNLQKTPKDNKASLMIHGRVDKVIAGVMSWLNMHIAPFVRIDFFQIIINQALNLDKKVCELDPQDRKCAWKTGSVAFC